LRGKYVKGTTLPCSADMGRWARAIEAFGDTKMPFKVGHIPHVGEFLAFEPADVIRLVIEVTGLTEDSKVRFVQLSDSIDGALITNNMGHVCYGVKVIDRKCVDPTTKQKTATLQSRNNVFPIVILIGKDNTKNVQQFFPAYFYAVQKSCNEKIPQKYGLNVELTHNADMSELLGNLWGEWVQ
jgi:hypothetical protein